MKTVLKYLVMTGIGGLLYQLLEILFKAPATGGGTISWTMMLVGGICFAISGSINNILPWDMPLWRQMLLSAALITAVELTAGLVLNVWLGLGIWDYSDRWGNLFGQICPEWFIVWFFLSLPAILLADQVDYHLFDGQKPRYILFHRWPTISARTDGGVVQLLGKLHKNRKDS